MDKKEFFNQSAAGWDERFYTPEMRERLKGLVDQFGLAEGARVLDVGGGTGGIIPFLLPVLGPNGSVWSIDYAEEMVRLGKEKFRHEPRARFEVADVETLSFADGFFDHIVCFGAFPHFEDKRKALKEMFRVLRSGGKLTIAHALSSQEIRRHHQGAGPVSHDFLPEEDEMRRLLTEACFRVERLNDRPKCYLCQSTKV